MKKSLDERNILAKVVVFGCPCLLNVAFASIYDFFEMFAQFQGQAGIQVVRILINLIVSFSAKVRDLAKIELMYNLGHNLVQ